MRLVYQDNKYYLSVKNEYGEIENFMCFILGRSGAGKGLASENILEELHNEGYIIISLADPKDEIELGYAMFEPVEKYHLKNLNLIGKKKGTKKVKIYHPFTFTIPKTQLPEINFYTISLKELRREEWGLIAETSWDTDTIKLLMDASQNINNDDGIYGLLHYLRDAIKGQKHEGKKTRYDPKNFLLDVTSGTAKSLQDISNYIKPYRQDYFLAPNNSNTNLNWKEILQDQEHYHVFTSNWIKDKKLKGLLILYLFNKIIENKHYRTRPVAIFIPDIKNLCPFKPQGFELFLSQGIKQHLSTIRSIGKGGMSAVFDAQVWSDVDEAVKNSATVTLIGELGGSTDRERLSKANNYKRETRALLAKQEGKNCYLLEGEEDVGSVKIMMPSHMHCEPKYDFIEMYKKHGLPMKSYTELIKTKKKELEDEEKKFKERIKKREQEKKKQEEQARKEKEEKQQKTEKIQNIKNKAEETITKSKQDQAQIFYKLYTEEKQSLRQIAQQFGTSNHTVKKRIQEYKQQQETQKQEQIKENETM